LASHTANSSTTSTKHNRLTSLMLLGILIVLLILMVRPFGFRTFLHGLGENNIFSLLLTVCIVGIILVILQRAGIIFSENTYA
jgi:glucan phosphoethanolaminetransferase (alkaline phosphatase superfamily)